jgi:hypothetical protein
LLAIVAPDHEPNHAVARERGVPLFHDLEHCISRGGIDGIIISSPNQFHADQTTLCIKAGIPVLVEKPVTATVAEGEALVAATAKYGARVLVGHHRAHSPLLARAREIIREGRLGRLVSVMGSAQFYKPARYFEAGPWRTRAGGGPILINLIHEIGNLRSMCGEITAVHAFSSSAIRGYEVEDTVAINLMFANGVLGTFMLSDTAACARSWEQTSRENPVYPSYSDEDCYVIAGTQGIPLGADLSPEVSPGRDGSFLVGPVHGSDFGGGEARTPGLPAGALRASDPGRSRTARVGGGWLAQPSGHRGHCSLRHRATDRRHLRLCHGQGLACRHQFLFRADLPCPARRRA